MRKSDNLAAWRALIAAAETGSVSKASHLLGIDPATISQLINGLETEIGYKLLDRSVRPFVLTEKGHYLVDAVKPLACGFQEALDSLVSDNRSIITIAAPTDLNQCYFHEQIFRYSLSHPNVMFYLRSSCPVADVLSGRVDVALTERPGITTDLVVRFLFEAPAFPMATRRYIEKHGCPNEPADLVHHTGLLLRQGMKKMTSFLYNEDGQPEMIKWKDLFMTDAQLTLNQMMLQDKGVVVDCVPQHLLKELQSGEVVPVLRGWRRKPQELCLVTRRDREAANDHLHAFVLWWRNEEKRTGLARMQHALEIFNSLVGAHR